MTSQGTLSAPYHDSGMSSLTQSRMSPVTVNVPCDCSRNQERIVTSLVPRSAPVALYSGYESPNSSCW